MPVPDVRWLHRDRGKCLWTFSFCSNARSFDCPTMAKPGEKIKVPIFIRRKGADAFRPALAAGGSLMAYKCLSLCDFFIVQHVLYGFKLLLLGLLSGCGKSCVLTVKFQLTTTTRPILGFAHALLRAVEQIDLVQSGTFAQLHYLDTEVPHGLGCAGVLHAL